MNIDDLVTHYVTFRRTLGEQCIITEKDPAILLPRRRAGHASHPDPARCRRQILGWHRTDHEDVALQALRAEGLLPVRGQPRAPG